MRTGTSSSPVPAIRRLLIQRALLSNGVVPLFSVVSLLVYDGLQRSAGGAALRVTVPRLANATSPHCDCAVRAAAVKTAGGALPVIPSTALAELAAEISPRAPG